MALQRQRAGSFSDGQVYLEFVYDDADGLIRSIEYQNLTDKPASLEIGTPGGQMVFYLLAANKNASFSLQPLARPNLDASDVRMAWPTTRIQGPRRA